MHSIPSTCLLCPAPTFPKTPTLHMLWFKYSLLVNLSLFHHSPVNSGHIPPSSETQPQGSELSPLPQGSETLLYQIQKYTIFFPCFVGNAEIGDHNAHRSITVHFLLCVSPVCSIYTGQTGVFIHWDARGLSCTRQYCILQHTSHITWLWPEGYGLASITSWSLTNLVTLTSG